jgi:hypothetical protein
MVRLGVILKLSWQVLEVAFYGFAQRIVRFNHVQARKLLLLCR